MIDPAGYGWPSEGQHPLFGDQMPDGSPGRNEPTTCARCSEPIVYHGAGPEPHYCHVDRSIGHVARPKRQTEER